MKRAPRDPQPAKRWLTFLRNHREAIAAMDFFTIPTITFGVLYGFFVIAHDRRLFDFSGNGSGVGAGVSYSFGAEFTPNWD